jgi:mRNA interferase MazF
MTLSTTTYKWGDVLLVAFPRTDATGTVKRPALVLYDERDEDVMVARVTTQTARSTSDVALTDWKAAGLVAPSVVRLSKVATIKKSLVDKSLGALTSIEAQRVKGEWRALFP